MVKFIPIEYDDLVATFNKDINGKTVTNYHEVHKKMDLKSFIRNEVPTARFWLMMRIRNPEFFESRWVKYIESLRSFLQTRFVGEEKNVEVQKVLNKIEVLAWTSMPSTFLNQFNVPRVLFKRK